MLVVWMIVYNEEINLDRAIGSVLSQTHRDFVFYISDNHSTDSSFEIISKYAAADQRIKLFQPPKHCSALEHANYFYENVLNQLVGFRYSIFIGGHDAWSNNLLEMLLNRAACEKNTSIIYPDCCEIDSNNRIVRKFNDIIQTANVYKPFLPFHLLLGLTHNIMFNGLWNEGYRKQIDLRTVCCGNDHLLTVEMALLGDIIHQPGATLYLGQSPSHKAGIKGYVKKHLPPEKQNEPLEDFANQLYWAESLLSRTVQNFPLNNNKTLYEMLKSSFLVSFIIKHYPTLNGFDDGVNKFFNDETIRKIIELQLASTKLFADFIEKNRTK